MSIPSPSLLTAYMLYSNTSEDHIMSCPNQVGGREFDWLALMEEEFESQKPLSPQKEPSPPEGKFFFYWLSLPPSLASFQNKTPFSFWKIKVQRKPGLQHHIQPVMLP